MTALSCSWLFFFFIPLFERKIIILSNWQGLAARCARRGLFQLFSRDNAARIPPADNLCPQWRWENVCFFQRASPRESSKGLCVYGGAKNKKQNGVKACWYNTYRVKFGLICTDVIPFNFQPFNCFFFLLLIFVHLLRSSRALRETQYHYRLISPKSLARHGDNRSWGGGGEKIKRSRCDPLSYFPAS